MLLTRTSASVITAIACHPTDFNECPSVQDPTSIGEYLDFDQSMETWYNRNIHGPIPLNDGLIVSYLVMQENHMINMKLFHQAVEANLNARMGTRG